MKLNEKSLMAIVLLAGMMRMRNASSAESNAAVSNETTKSEANKTPSSLQEFMALLQGMKAGEGGQPVAPQTSAQQQYPGMPGIPGQAAPAPAATTKTQQVAQQLYHSDPTMYNLVFGDDMAFNATMGGIKNNIFSQAGLNPNNPSGGNYNLTNSLMGGAGAQLPSFAPMPGYAPIPGSAPMATGYAPTPAAAPMPGAPNYQFVGTLPPNATQADLTKLLPSPYVG